MGAMLGAGGLNIPFIDGGYSTLEIPTFRTGADFAVSAVELNAVTVIWVRKTSRQPYRTRFRVLVMCGKPS